MAVIETEEEVSCFEEYHEYMVPTISFLASTAINTVNRN
jgi:hypothetical protein